MKATTSDIRCLQCGIRKHIGTAGHEYCPNKHGDGTGKHGIANQPKSDYHGGE